MFDLRNLPAGFYADPYPTYRAIQREHPVFELPDGSWFLTRYADLDEVYRDTARFTSDKRAEFRPKFGASPLFDHHTTSLVFNDPPLHTRVRRLIAGALTPRALAAMEPDIVALVDRLLDGLSGQVDLIAAFASAIPVEVIGNLLGVPHADRGRCGTGRWRSSARWSLPTRRRHSTGATKRCGTSWTTWRGWLPSGGAIRATQLAMC